MLALIKRLSAQRTETLAVFLYDSRGRFLKSIERQGDIKAVTWRYRDLVHAALTARAAGMVLIHNHPSGDPQPSEEDIAATMAIGALCVPLDLTLHDHLIVGGSRVVSLRQGGLLGSPLSPKNCKGH